MKHGLPNWIARDERDRAVMIEWVNDELGKQMAARISEGLVEPYRGSVSMRFAEMAAWHGNIKPLRDLYPRLAPFLHLPKRGRGEHPRVKRAWALQQAVDDVDRIHALWKEKYGKKNRRRDNGPSAVEIAASRWCVDVEQVVSRLKSRKAG